MKPTFALCITHAPWGPGRVRSLAHLLEALQPLPAETFVWDGREPNWAWSERIWTWGAERGPDVSHVVFLQDDVRVAPDFWDSLTALIDRFPENLIGLETIHPKAMRWALQGHRAYRVRDCCVGVGYVWPKAKLRDNFLPWTRSELLPGVRQSMEPTGYVTLSEDTLMACWAHAKDERIVSPLPTLIDHDLTLPSTYGHANESAQDAPSPTWKDWPSADLLDWSGPVREAGWQYGLYILDACRRFVRNPLAPPIAIGETPPHPDDTWTMKRGTFADGDLVVPDIDAALVMGGERLPPDILYR